MRVARSLLCAFMPALAACVVVLGASCEGTPASADAGPPPAPDAGPPAPAFVAEVKVTRVEGVVEVRRFGTEVWEPVGIGATLKKDDAVRTSSDASAELDASGTILELTPGTDVKVGELTADLARYLLGSGLISANASADGAPDLQLNVEGTDVEVKSSDGRFRVASNGEGTVAVGATAGSVSVSSLGKAVVLKQGERTLVAPGKQPSAPEPLAPSLLLKVAWPSERETNKRRVTVTGRTAAGALVFAMGRRIPVGADGRFSAQVQLREGDNALSLRASDVSGNAAQQVGPRVHVDTRGAASRFKTDNLWGR